MWSKKAVAAVAIVGVGVVTVAAIGGLAIRDERATARNLRTQVALLQKRTQLWEQEARNAEQRVINAYNHGEGTPNAVLHGPSDPGWYVARIIRGQPPFGQPPESKKYRYFLNWTPLAECVPIYHEANAIFYLWEMSDEVC